MDSTDNYERVYFPESIQCPECGLPTHELARMEDYKVEYKVKMICDSCYEENYETE